MAIFTLDNGYRGTGKEKEDNISPMDHTILDIGKTIG